MNGLLQPTLDQRLKTRPSQPDERISVQNLDLVQAQYYSPVPAYEGQHHSPASAVSGVPGAPSDTRLSPARVAS